MREIKFRAYDTKNKKWLLGYDYGSLGGFSMMGECMMMGEWAEVLSAGLSGQNGYELSDIEVMQFTGLHDKNGKEIYEGDVVKTKWQEKAKMEWIDTEAAFALRTIDEVVTDEIMYGFKDTDMEVIGNIYENPDLLSN